MLSWHFNSCATTWSRDPWPTRPHFRVPWRGSAAERLFVCKVHFMLETPLTVTCFHAAIA